MRRAFTLIELVAVIAILVVLVSLLLVAVTGAIGTAGTAQVRAEIELLHGSVERYKSDRGDYPPSLGTVQVARYDGSGAELQADKFDRLFRHVRKCWPRYSGDAASVVAEIEAAANAGQATGVPRLDLSSMDAAESLVFWLGGFPRWSIDPDAQDLPPAELRFPDHYRCALIPFSGDPQRPFADESEVSQRLEPAFKFDTQRLIDVNENGWPEYKPAGSYSIDVPYVYFNHRAYARGAEYAGGFGVARPYVDDAEIVDPEDPTTWIVKRYVNQESFQIIWAGRDHTFGEPSVSQHPNAPSFVYAPRIFRTSLNSLPGDGDNVTNFATTTIERDRE